MAGTINDLYLKYVNKVGKTLENDRYFQYLFEMVQAGSTTLKQTHQVLHKVVDEKWLSVIEESLEPLNRITDHPRRFVTTSEEVVPVELAKKITADSVRHLSMNTQFIASNENGEIHPTRILNVTTEETYNLYENRFIYHLIQRLVTFIDKRTDVIFWSTGDETRNCLSMQTSVDDAYEQIEYKLEMTVKNTQSFAENDSENMHVFMRIDRVRRMVMALRNSSFCDLMQGCSKVTSPIQRTNTIMKDPDYRACFKLWQFLESYEEVGYSIDAQDTALEFDEEYMIQLYSNLITNYTVFKSLLEADSRKLDEIPPKRRKVIKPKFVKKIEEQIVDDYDIPEVEIRKVIVEGVTQGQLDAEAKLAEETALREAAEAAREDAEHALQEYRWQADFQMGEAMRQAEEQLNRVKEDAQANLEHEQAMAKEALEQQKAQAQQALEQQQAQAQEALEQQRAEAEAQQQRLQGQLQEAAQREQILNAQLDAQKQSAQQAMELASATFARRESAINARMEAIKGDAQQALNQANTLAAQREEALKTQYETAQAEAAKALEQTNAAAAAREETMKAQVKAAKEDAEKALTLARQEAAQREQALKAELEAAREGYQRMLEQAKKEAQQREAELNAKVEATRRRAKESSAYAQAQQKEMAATLKSTQAALEEAQKARDDALKQQRMAQQKAEEAAAALEEARRRAEENKFTKKFLEAVSLRREDKNKQSKDSE